MEQLNEYRNKLDKLDYSLIEILKKRVDIVEDIKEYKKNNRIEIYDKTREDSLLRERKKYANEIGISENFIENIFLTLLKFVKKIK